PAARLQWERIERITSRLSRDVTSLRLVPFDSVTHRFVRAARELSRELGRPVNFRVEGREVQVDRAMIENLADPILHMIRNAVGHGIEDPAERRARGKPVPAVLTLSLARSDGGVVLRLQDDGRGMDPGRIRNRARALGFLTERQAASLGHLDTLMLVTLPGFSTAERVTELSGRGVGMDVVRTRVEKMGGRLSIRSETGAGTTIELRLPLTIAVVRAFLVTSA